MVSELRARVFELPHYLGSPGKNMCLLPPPSSEENSLGGSLSQQRVPHPPTGERRPEGSLDLIAISPTGRSPETAPPSVRAAGCRDHPEGSAVGLRCQKEGAGLVEFSLHCDPGLFGSSCKGGVATCF